MNLLWCVFVLMMLDGGTKETIDVVKGKYLQMLLLEVGAEGVGNLQREEGSGIGTNIVQDIIVILCAGIQEIEMCVDHISEMNDLSLDGRPLADPAERTGAVCILMMQKDNIPVIGTERQELGVDLTDGTVTDHEIELAICTAAVIPFILDLLLVEFGQRIIV